MKSKISRILGVGLTIAMLTSLMVVASPASAAPSNLVYDTIATPSAVGGVLQAGTDVDFLVAAPDGVTMFAFSKAAPTPVPTTLAAPSTTTVGSTSVNATTIKVASTATFASSSTLGGPLTVGAVTGVTYTSTNATYFIGIPQTAPAAGSITAIVATGAAVSAAFTGQGATVINVASTDGFAAAGTLTIGTVTGITYAAKTATAPIQFTGLSGTLTKQAVGVTVTGTAQGVLYKSTNAGLTWAATETAVTPSLADVGSTVIALAISPNYATDGIIVAATGTAVWYSADGGATFASVAPDNLTTMREGGTITSMDIGTYIVDGKLSVLVGITGGGATYSNVLRFPTGTWSWLQVGAAGGYLSENVVAVRFSPVHTSDALILAVSTNAADTHLNTQFGSMGWGVNTAQATVKAAAVATGAVLAFGSDYIGTGASQTILVGIRGAGGTLDDVYRVTQSYGVAASAATRLNVTGTTTSPADNNIKSLAVSGPIATAKVLVGLTNSNIVYRTSSPAASTITWTASTKSPTGGATSPTTVLWVGDTAYAGTTGADSALSKSTDSGANFNQLALIDVGTIANVSLVDIEAVDASTMFLMMRNTTAGFADMSLFKTTNGGTSWERVWTIDPATTVIVKASPNYATDSTVYVADGSQLLKKSIDGGATFTSVGVPAAVTALTLVDGTNYFTGAAAKVYRSGYWAAATGIPAGNTVTSIALSPRYATDSTLIVGTDKGTVYQSTNNAVSFTMVNLTAITTGPGGATDTMYVAYDSNCNIYAGASTLGTASISRWVPAAYIGADGTTTYAAGWLKIQTTALVRGLVVTSDNILYAASNTANEGIWRSLTPAVDTAAKCEFQAMNNAQAATFLLPLLAKMEDLSVVGNVLYGIASGIAAETYGYPGRLVGITDILTGKPNVTAPTPETGAELPTSITDLTVGVTSAKPAWDAMTGATDYIIEASLKSDFATVITKATIKLTDTVSGLTGGTSYWYRVRATKPVYSQYSGLRSFITNLPAITAPAAATWSPAFLALDVSATPTFTWPVITGAKVYDFEISTDEYFTTVDYSYPCLTNSYTQQEALAYSTTYYWRIRGVSDLITSAWSVSRFITIAEPAPEVGQYMCPVDGLRFTTQAELEAHQAAAHPTAAVKYTCPQCGLSYDTQAALSAHWNASHAPKEAAPSIPTYLLWTIIGIGAVLIIALIILIVRTRRVA